MERIHFWQLPTYVDKRGSLCPIDEGALPFKPKRIYFLYDVSEKRGGHAHRQEKEVFVCIQGSFRGRIHDGKRWRTFTFKKPGQALYSDSMTWHEFYNFSSDGVMLAISSTIYKGQKGYIIDFKEFKKLCAKKSS